MWPAWSGISGKEGLQWERVIIASNRHSADTRLIRNLTIKLWMMRCCPFTEKKKKLQLRVQANDWREGLLVKVCRSMKRELNVTSRKLTSVLDGMVILKCCMDLRPSSWTRRGGHLLTTFAIFMLIRVWSCPAKRRPQKHKPPKFLVLEGPLMPNYPQLPSVF